MGTDHVAEGQEPLLTDPRRLIARRTALPVVEPAPGPGRAGDADAAGAVTDDWADTAAVTSIALLTVLFVS